MKRFGFTLAEVLIAALLASAGCAIAVQAARQTVNIMEHLSRRTLAWERGQYALSIIEPRALHAALGLTYSRAGDVFRRSFGNGDDSPPPAGWTDRGPLQIWDGYPLSLADDDEGVFRGCGIAIMYAVPGALRVALDAPAALSSDVPAVVKLIPGAPTAEVSDIISRLPTTDRRDLRSWVTFPLTRLPMYAVYSVGSAGKLTVCTAGTGLSGTLYPYDEVHYIRAERFYVQNGTLYSEELRTSWTQFESRLEGVLEIWFEWTPSKKLLEAWILTTGGSALSERPEDWPVEAPWQEGFELHDIAVTRGSWVLKNM